MSPRSERAMRAITAVLGAIAVLWLGYEFWRLLLQPKIEGAAIDLRLRRNEVVTWASGQPVYADLDAVYPPASYLMLWPLTGWLSVPAVRWLWGGVAAMSLAWLVRLVAREGRPGPAAARRLLVVSTLATYSVGATIGNGQVSILVICCLLTAVPMLGRPRSWPRDMSIAVFFVLALVKPSVAAPFFWIVALVPGGARAACLVVVAYVALTAVAALPQPVGPIELLDAWLYRADRGAYHGASAGQGSIDLDWEIKSINLHSVVMRLGYPGLLRHTTIALLAALGVWTWLHRRAPVWLLMAVVALVARFSTYHGWYDDVLLILPLVALFRLACEDGAGRTPLVMFGAMALTLLAPGGLYVLPHPWSSAYVVVQTLCWLVVLGYLAWIVRERVTGVRRTGSRAARTSPGR